LACAVIALRMNIATVTGPTPPGTGVTQLATSFTPSVSTSPTIDRLAVRAGDLVDADVDDRRARLDHVGVQELRFADRDEHGIGRRECAATERVMW
jgi:hypothetical protein